MKPNFAFTLSYKGIGLLHRAFPGWLLVGEVGFDSADLSAALAELRQKADQLDSSGVRAKLVIPNDQIKYIALPAQNSSGDNGDLSPEDRVRAALIGATPYEVDDLAFDWTVTRDQILIAAVAKETLKEAEDFANEHHFQPVCFVAIPDSDRYEGEPFFGQTLYSETVLESGQIVGRDQAAISVIGTAPLPAQKDESIPAAVPASETVETFENGAAVAEPTPVQPIPKEDAKAEHNKAELPAGKSAAETGKASVEPQEEIPAPVTEFSSIRARRSDFAQNTPQGAPHLNGADRATPVAVTGTESDNIPKSGALTAPSIPISKADDLAVPNPPKRRFTPVLAEDEGGLEQHQETQIAPAPNFTPDLDKIDDTGPDIEVPAPKESFFSRRSSGRARGKKASNTAIAAAPSNAFSNQFPAPEDEKQRMTVFGARENNDIGGKPRYLGLILTMVLLVFLAGVAAWATIFLEDGLAGLFSPENETVIALPQPETGEDELAAELAVEGDEATVPEAETFLPPAQELALLTPDDAPLPNALPQPVDPTLDAALNPAQNPPVTFDPDQAVADYAATGIWQIAPDQPQVPGFQGLDSLYITSIDRAVATSDAVALPQAEAALSDHQPRSQLSPVAPEVRFAYDARGLVIATKDGALTPDGITIFLGRPVSTPPTRPTRFEQNPVLIAQAVRLAKTRPRLRPGNLIEQNERSTLGGRTRIEMARLRPTARPHVDAGKLAEEADETATAQAVTTSRKPSARPRNFNRIVQRAQRQQETVTTVAAVAPRTVTPSVPSNASVARLATARNAINLRRVNLIGVYGKPSSRRALVRLANGRYKKVKVGDRIDGGRISAIGESELRYVKGGRNVVLKMPRS